MNQVSFFLGTKLAKDVDEEAWELQGTSKMGKGMSTFVRLWCYSPRNSPLCLKNKTEIHFGGWGRIHKVTTRWSWMTSCGLCSSRPLFSSFACFVQSQVASSWVMTGLQVARVFSCDSVIRAPLVTFKCHAWAEFTTHSWIVKKTIQT